MSPQHELTGEEKKLNQRKQVRKIEVQFRIVIMFISGLRQNILNMYLAETILFFYNFIRRTAIGETTGKSSGREGDLHYV